ncbi:MAG: class I SAM-dependent methyltransferase [Gammaproteobacteria bacterium]|nr:class I SAM-dependent methyltransferase [Gammaproteobacteria bacterium]
MSNQACPLCKNIIEPIPYFENKIRPFFQCLNCDLVFVPERCHLSKYEEKRIYDLHENIASDSGYQKFISRLTTPLIKEIKQNSCGLDFGSGNSSAIPLLLKEKTNNISLYDKFYARNEDLLHKQYDFITCTEVFEHLKEPDKVIQQLLNCLNPGGIFAIMTKRVIDQQAFSNWHYKNDLTHIIFFSENTFNWIAKKFSLELEIIDKDIVFLYKTPV